MITIKLDENQKTINIPQSWNEICLGDYEKWFDLQPENHSDEIKLIAQICKVDENTFLDNPTRLFDIVAESLSFVFDENNHQAAHQIEIEGIEYSISFSDELTLAEWIDVELAFEDEKLQSRLSGILSILCRPRGERYDSKRCESRKEMFANLSMDKVFPLLSFFLQQNEVSEMTSSLYSYLQDQSAQYLRIIQGFVENGDGIKSLPIWQRIRYFFLSKYLENRLSKSSDSFSTRSIK